MTTRGPYNPDRHAHPGLVLIALFEASKGLLAFLVAAGLEISGPRHLRIFVDTIIRRVGADPEHGTLSALLGMITPHTVHLGMALLVSYGLLRMVEAWGLWRIKAWASWLGCVSAALYLPLDIYAIVRHPGWATWLLLVVNLIVVLALALDLRRRKLSKKRAEKSDA